MISQHFIFIQNTPTSTTSPTGSIPHWVKNNAGWWADSSIDDQTYISSITYLIERGYIILTSPGAS
jgi:hypothetical protein